MQTEALFITAQKKKKKGEQPRCLGEWINKWYMYNYTMENKVLICTTWMNIKYILLRSQIQKARYSMFPVRHTEKDRTGMTDTWKCYCSVYY